MPKILHLFPDTNLFVQCRPLHQLSWEEWIDFEEVNLVVVRPVQSEIDKHKNKGSDRLAKRARSASALIRDLINAPDNCKIIRASKPLVRLSLRADLRPDEKIADILDYGEPDDRLVGIAYGFSLTGADTRILTHDTGRMAAAKTMGIPFVEIPDGWLLAPETTDAEKKVRALEQEIAHLRANEPLFKIECFDAGGTSIEKFETQIVRYPELNAGQREDLLNQLRVRVPMVEDFGPREPPPRPVPKLPASNPLAIAGWQLAQSIQSLGLQEEFVPASEKEIVTYRAAYAKWLADCEKILGGLHASLNSCEPMPLLCFYGQNDGSRPGRDVLVTVQASGNFLIWPPLDQTDEDEAASNTEAAKLPSLPSPPRAPYGRWQRRTLGIMDNSFARANAFALPNYDAILPRIDRPRFQRDPNGFYWKPKKPMTPVSSFCLECQQWRHAIDPEEFALQIFAHADAEMIRGIIECSVHAENLSEPTALKVPIRIAVKVGDTFEIGRRLVGELLSR